MSLMSPSSGDPELGDGEAQVYRMRVSQRYLDLTKRKLELTRLPRELQLSEAKLWESGIPKTTLEPLIDHWIEHYDWRAQEAVLNDRLPQYRMTISTSTYDFLSESSLRIHFVHKRSPNPDAIPLLFCHGWPGSFIEAVNIIEMLTQPVDGSPLGGIEPIPFHVVIPSIPGFGFSDASRDVDFGLRSTANVFNKLMSQLGYSRYVAHGSGWGFNICRMLAIDFGDNCLAVHTVNPTLPPPTLRRSPLAYIKYQLARLTHCRVPLLSFGYSAADFDAIPPSSTFSEIPHYPRPQTISYSLCDSPSGLLAYMVDLLKCPMNNVSWSAEDVLNWTMMQWLPGPEAGLRWVKKASEESESDLWERYSTVALGISQFGEGSSARCPPNWASAVQKLSWVKRRRDAVRFPAWDQGANVVVDIREFFGELTRKGVLPSYSGGEVLVEEALNTLQVPAWRYLGSRAAMRGYELIMILVYGAILLIRLVRVL